MRLILVLTLKDLRRRLADPAGLLLHLAIPLALAGMMALTFGGKKKDDQNAAPVLRVLVVDLDRSPIARFISGASQNPEAAKHLEIQPAQDREEGLRRLRDEEFAALLIIPEGFGKSVLDGSPADLDLVKNPSQTVMPVVAQQGAEVVALYLTIARRLLGDDAARVQSLFEGEGWRDAGSIASLVTALYHRIQAARALLFPPLIDFETLKNDAQTGEFDFLAWMFPGMVVMGLLFTGLSQMKDLLRERAEGTLKRQLAGPLGAGQVLLSKILTVAIVTAASLAVLLLIGSLLFGIRWGAPGPLLLTSLLLVLAVTGFAALVFALVRTQRQGDALGGISTMVMSLLGGAFIPPQVLPPGLREGARFTLNYWGHEALRALASGGGWGQIAGDLTILAAFGAATTALGVALLARRHVRGTL